MAIGSGSGREKRGNPADGGGTPPGAKGEARTGAKLDKTRTKFHFLRPSPDESTVEVVFSFLAGTKGDGAKFDKTRTKFRI